METITNQMSLPDGSTAVPINYIESLEICEIANAFIDYLYAHQIALLPDSFENVLWAIERYLEFNNKATVTVLEHEFYTWCEEQNPITVPYSILTIIAYVVAAMHSMICEENVYIFWWQSDFGKTLSVKYYGKLIDLEVAIRNYLYLAEYEQPLLPNLDFYRIEYNNKEGVKVGFTPELTGYLLQ